MGILDQIGAALGLAGVTLRIELTGEASLFQGEEVRGVLHLAGGQHEQVVNGLVLSLVSFWHSRDEEGYERTATQVMLEEHLPGCGPMGAGQAREVPFCMRLPIGVGLSNDGQWWKLRATADVPGAVDPGASLDVTVLPPKPVMEIQRAVEQSLGWVPKPWAQKGSPKGSIRLLFTPPTSLQGDYDDLRVNILCHDGRMDIIAVLDQQEKGALDFLRAALRRDLREERRTASTPHEVIEWLAAMIDRHRARSTAGTP